MSNTIRFGVSLDADLLEKFDALCVTRGYATRSEAIRDLIRKALVEEDWRESDKDLAATLTIVYDHHVSDLSQRLTAVQHDYHQLIVSTLHVHLDHDNCLEVLVLKGNSVQINDFAARVTATRGVKYGRLNPATTGRGLS